MTLLTSVEKKQQIDEIKHAYILIMLCHVSILIAESIKQWHVSMLIAVSENRMLAC